LALTDLDGLDGIFFVGLRNHHLRCPATQFSHAIRTGLPCCIRDGVKGQGGSQNESKATAGSPRTIPRQLARLPPTN